MAGHLEVYGSWHANFKYPSRISDVNVCAKRQFLEHNPPLARF
jgi:hypothetical protein